MTLKLKVGIEALQNLEIFR